MNEHQVAVAGSGGVGMRALTIQFLQQQFVADYQLTIEDTYRISTYIESLETQTVMIKLICVVSCYISLI